MAHKHPDNVPHLLSGQGWLGRGWGRRRVESAATPEIKKTQPWPAARQGDSRQFIERARAGDDDDNEDDDNDASSLSVWVVPGGSPPTSLSLVVGRGL